MEDSKSAQPKKAPEDQEKPVVPESEKDIKDREKQVAAESGTAEEEVKSTSPESEKTESGVETGRKSINIEITQTSPDNAGEGSQLSPVTSDTTSGIEMGSGSATPSYALSGTETGSDPNILSAADTSGDVTPPVKTKGKFWSFFTSPNKKDSNFSVSKEKSRSRFSFSKMRGSRSLSPEKSLKVAAESESIPPAEGACAKSNDKDSAEKTDKGLYTRIKRTWSGILGKKSSSTESDSLVSNVEGGKTDTKLAGKKETEKIEETDDENVTIPHWTANRTSLVSQLSLSMTTTTDLPSTRSGSEVFVTEGGAKSSEGSENTSQEALAGSLASSSVENISRAETDKEHGSKKVKNDAMTTDECSNKKDETKSDNQKPKEPSDCKDDKNSQPDT